MNNFIAKDYDINFNYKINKIDCCHPYTLTPEQLAIMVMALFITTPNSHEQ